LPITGETIYRIKWAEKNGRDAVVFADNVLELWKIYTSARISVKPIPDYAKLTINPNEFSKEPLKYLVDLY
jgi:hypothetical protein